MLTPEQEEEFCRQGYIVLRGAFDREDAIGWVRAECARVGYDLDDPDTWTKEYDRIPTERREKLKDYAPEAWQAACDLMGGEERVARPAGIGLFAVNFRQGADKPPIPPQEAQGWHIDGWHFRHFLDSPEQGLLGIPLMTDVLPCGGATWIAADSVPVIARYLAERPQGEVDYQMSFRDLVSQCKDFREVTGRAGDFYLLHPFTLHAVSQNHLRKARAICNICFTLKEPMQLDRADGAYSPVERGILRGLGVDRYEFQITGERYVTPDNGPINPAWRKP